MFGGTGKACIYQVTTICASLSLICACVWHGLHYSLATREESLEKSERAPTASLTWWVKQWSVDEIAPLLATSLRGRDFERGRLLFSVAHCCDCHRFCGVGGGVGPDLSALAKRLNAQQTLVAILDPNNSIGDQYATVRILTVSGRVVVGKVLDSTSYDISVDTNGFQPAAVETIKREDIAQISTQLISTMPTGLLNAFSQDDIFDLLAYLLSDGNPGDAMFQHPSSERLSESRGLVSPIIP